MNSKILKEKRHKLIQEMEELFGQAGDEGFTDEQRTKYNEMEEKVRKLDKDIVLAEAHEERKAKAATAEFNILNEKRNKGGEKGEKDKIKKDYSLQKLIRSQMKNGTLDGLELEMHQEAIKELRQIGKGAQGGAVPEFLCRAYSSKREERAVSVTTTPANAGNLVDTTLGNIIPVLEPRLMVESMGAEVITGLVGNLDFPKDNKKIEANWEGEIDENSEDDLDYGLVSGKPKRLGVKTRYSRQQLFQTNFDLERIVREKLETAIRRKLDYTAINGSGAGNIPMGILNLPGLKVLSLGANGDAIGWNPIVGLETEIAKDDADMGSLGYLTTPKVRGQLKTIKLDSNNGGFIMGQDQTTLNSYNVGFTNQVPQDLTKGTGQDLNAMIYGDWSSMKVLQWSGFDIVVDEVTLADFAQVKVTANSYWDILFEYEKAFAAIKDIVIP